MARRNVVEVIIKGEDKASNVISGVSRSMTTMARIATVQLAGAVFRGVRQVSGEMVQLAREAATLQGVERAFEGLAESAGRGMDSMLRSLREGAAGMVSNRDLMLSFNKAAQLVSVDFAERLPDAMESLRKVSAATGDSMDFLLNSLVTGIGRVSPMILDNLGIQVDLTAATEAYAASVGKSVDELSKSEQQTALMNQVMEKLATNTANMPDVVGTAAQRFAALDARMQNLRDTMGRLLLPVLEQVMDAFTGLTPLLELLLTGEFTGDIFGMGEDSPMVLFVKDLRNSIKLLRAEVPILDIIEAMLLRQAATAQRLGRSGLAQFFFNLADSLNSIRQSAAVEAISLFFREINLGVPILIALEDSLTNLFGSQVAGPIVEGIRSVLNLFSELRTTLGNLFAEIDLGAIGEFVLNILKLTSPLAIINSLLQEVFGVSLLDVVTKAIDIVSQFFADINAGATPIEALQAALNSVFGEGTASEIGTTIQNIVGFITGTLIPGFLDIVTTVRDLVQPIIDDFISTLTDIWTMVEPSLSRLGAWFTESILPMIVDFINNTVVPALDVLIGLLGSIWEEIGPTLGQVFGWFMETGLPLIIDFITGPVTTGFQNFLDFISSMWDLAQPGLTLLKSGMDEIFGFIRTFVIQPVLDAIDSIVTAILNVQGEVSRVVTEISNTINSINFDPFAEGGFLHGLRPFQSGGFTGSGMRGQVAGITHVNEFVVPEDGALVMRGDPNPNVIQVIFNGPGPADQQEADDMGFMITGGLKARGVNIVGP